MFHAMINILLSPKIYFEIHLNILMPGSLRRLHGSGHSGMAMEVFEEHEGTHILQSLDGFAISLASDGRFLYISETVSIYLGLSQVRIEMSHSIVTCVWSMPG